MPKQGPTVGPRGVLAELYLIRDFGGVARKIIFHTASLLRHVWDAL